MQTPSERSERTAPTEQQDAVQRTRWTTAPSSEPTPSVNRGWRLFAATMILIGGFFNVVDGLIAVFDTNYYVTISQTGNGPQLVVTDNLNTWGWVAFGMGIVMLITAGGIYLTTTAGQVVGVIIAGANMIFQLAFLPVFPIWALIMILVDVLVIYGLVARYRDTTSLA